MFVLYFRWFGMISLLFGEVVQCADDDEEREREERYVMGECEL